MYKTVYCEWVTQFSYIGTKNIREDELNPRLRYTILLIDNWQKTCTRWVIGDKKYEEQDVLMDLTRLSRNELDWELSLIRLNYFEIFNEFNWMKRTLKTVLRIFLRTCKTVSRKKGMNRVSKSKS